MARRDFSTRIPLQTPGNPELPPSECRKKNVPKLKNEPRRSILLRSFYGLTTTEKEVQGIFEVT
jgi:hypothetical protein